MFPFLNEKSLFQVQRRKVTVPVPAGVEDGQTMRMQVGKKELFISFRVEKSNYFKREGADVHTEANISLSQAILGGTIRVQGVYDDQVIQIMPGTSSHARICLSNKGLKRVNSYGQGHHYVNIKIQIPTKLSDKQRALIHAFAELEDDTPGQILGVVHKKDGKSSSTSSTNFKAEREEPISEKFTQRAKDMPAYEAHDKQGTHEFKKNNPRYGGYFFLGFSAILIWWMFYNMTDMERAYKIAVPPNIHEYYDDTDLKRSPDTKRE